MTTFQKSQQHERRTESESGIQKHNRFTIGSVRIPFTQRWANGAILDPSQTTHRGSICSGELQLVAVLHLTPLGISLKCLDELEKAIVLILCLRPHQPAYLLWYRPLRTSGTANASSCLDGALLILQFTVVVTYFYVRLNLCIYFYNTTDRVMP